MSERRVARRIGVTMRVLNVGEYPELRDTLAQDWGVFLSRVMPESRWLAIANLRRHVVDYVSAWRLDGIVFTGGSNPCPVRDETETALFEWALAENFPVLGVCRGLQRIQAFFGGGLVRCPENSHAGCRHPIQFTEESARVGISPGRGDVNSFHHFGITVEQLAAPMIAFATTADGWVEGASTKSGRVAGIMWHPERERALQSHDIQLVRNVFGAR